MKSKKLIADSQCSARNPRDAALQNEALPATPYPRGQSIGVTGILRIDKKFRGHGPEKFKIAYTKRVAIERVFSRLKNLISLT